MEVGAILEGQRDQLPILDRGDRPGQDELAERLDGGGLGHAQLVLKVGQGGRIILPGGLDELAGRFGLDLGERHVGRLDLAGLEAARQLRPRACR